MGPAAAGRFFERAAAELLRAEAAHPPLKSHHEGYAVLLEELDEYWLQVKLKDDDRNPENMLLELVQVAAMAARAAVNLRLIQ
jgi:hypothetical protein